MKGTRKRNKSATAISRRDLIVSEWRRLGAASLGADELIRIQQAIGEAFGQGAVESPSAIARELAHEGAELRHPEIIECDARWREAYIDGQLKTFGKLSALEAVEPLRLKQAESLIRKLEQLRARFERTSDDGQVTELRACAIDARRAAVSRAKDASLPVALRHEQVEIAKWLMVWLETPNLFQQWIELRKGSPAFKERFSNDD
ncbi:MAG TPA: hypothetical protein VK557_10945 [Pyrinomonadaceae bacterium]|nr:hypothetical protein [Pyrinomonadaceae bacterium]